MLGRGPGYLQVGQGRQVVEGSLGDAGDVVAVQGAAAEHRQEVSAQSGPDPGPSWCPRLAQVPPFHWEPHCRQQEAPRPLWPVRGCPHAPLSSRDSGGEGVGRKRTSPFSLWNVG